MRAWRICRSDASTCLRCGAEVVTLLCEHEGRRSLINCMPVAQAASYAALLQKIANFLSAAQHSPVLDAILNASVSGLRLEHDAANCDGAISLLQEGPKPRWASC